MDAFVTRAHVCYRSQQQGSMCCCSQCPVAVIGLTFGLFSAQAPWSEFMQDDAAKNNATRLFCTEALQIDVPRERMSDR